MLTSSSHGSRRFLVHVQVEDLDENIAFHSRLSGAEPTRVESDDARWMLADPRIGFAISTRGARPGVDHLGIQNDSEEELEDLKSRVLAADMALPDDGQATRCYARNDNYRVAGPQDIGWELSHTQGNVPVFSERQPSAAPASSACCAPAAPRGKPVSTPVKTSSSCCREAAKDRLEAVGADSELGPRGPAETSQGHRDPLK